MARCGRKDRRKDQPLNQHVAIDASKGELSLRLATSDADVEACQRLRYRVFCEELGASLGGVPGIDADRFDPICDHLMVMRHGELAGTYRLLRQKVAEQNGGFYTADEFDIAPLIARHPHLRFLELGRSCVLAPYRTKPVVELLWQGIWNYVRVHGIDVMIGCASLEGTDPEAHALPLSFLAAHASAPAQWHVRARPERHIEMRRVPVQEIDVKAALKSLPPLIKGYLRVGCHVGEGAVIDHAFNTIDVLIVQPVSAIDRRYFAHFGQPAS